MYTRMYIQKYTRTYMYTRTYTYIYTYTQEYMYGTYKYIQECMHTDTHHTYIHGRVSESPMTLYTRIYKNQS